MSQSGELDGHVASNYVALQELLYARAETDRILMDDFNADNQKIDAVLTAHAKALAGCGNCKIEYGTYCGDGSAVTGAYGSEQNFNTLAFSGQPLLIVISCESLNDKLLMQRKAPYGYVMMALS